MRPGNSRRCSPAPASRISAPSRSSWLLPTPGDLAPPLVKLSSSHALASGVGPEPIFLSVTEGLEIRAINFSMPMAHVLSPSNKRHRDSPAPSLWHPLLSVFQPRICDYPFSHASTSPSPDFAGSGDGRRSQVWHWNGTRPCLWNTLHRCVVHSHPVGPIDGPQ